MPELPEVETIRLQLNTVLPELIIKDIQILSVKSFIGESSQVVGRKIVGVRRFAKLLVIDLAGGLSLAVHLKMTGQLIFRTNNIKHSTFNKNNKTTELLNNLPDKHTRVIIDFTSGDRLYFNDLRKFGWIRVVRNKPINTNNPINPDLIGVNQLSNLNNLIKNLGPEPLKDLTLIRFQDILKSSNKPVKLVLMDQEKIAGVGNIYANEALFMTGIDPGRKAKELSNGQMVKLLNCLERVLKDGIKWGGASSNNYVNAYGQKGKMQEHCLVYRKEGQLCPNKCGEKIKRMKLGGRGTFYCSQCQPN